MSPQTGGAAASRPDTALDVAEFASDDPEPLTNRIFVEPSVPEDLAPRAVVDSCRGALRCMGGPALTTVGVTSTVRGEGRTTVAAALVAVEHFDYGRSAVLVEMDLDGATLASRLGLHDHAGVADVVRGERGVESALCWHTDSLAVLTAGNVHDEAFRLIATLRSGDLVADLRRRFDVVVVDLPPLPPAGLGGDLAGACSTVVMVVRAEATPTPEVARAAALLDPAPWLLLNCARRKRSNRFAKRRGGADS